MVDIELSMPFKTIENLDGYRAIQGLVRLHGTPLGYIKIPLIDGGCTATVINQAILDRYGSGVLGDLLRDVLMAGSQAGTVMIPVLPNLPYPADSGPLPAVTVAVCTRDRTSDLARCLESLNNLDYPALDMVVVDNAPGLDRWKGPRSMRNL